MRQKWGKNGEPNCTEIREHSIRSQDFKMHYKAYIYKFYKVLHKILKMIKYQEFLYAFLLNMPHGRVQYDFQNCESYIICAFASLLPFWKWKNVSTTHILLSPLDFIYRHSCAGRTFDCMVGMSSELLIVRLLFNARGRAAFGVTVVCPYTLLYKGSSPFP